MLLYKIQRSLDNTNNTTADPPLNRRGVDIICLFMGQNPQEECYVAAATSFNTFYVGQIRVRIMRETNACDKMRKQHVCQINEHIAVNVCHRVVQAHGNMRSSHSVLIHIPHTHNTTSTCEVCERTVSADDVTTY